jgi:hypothetical protein
MQAASVCALLVSLSFLKLPHLYSSAISFRTYSQNFIITITVNDERDLAK